MIKVLIAISLVVILAACKHDQGIKVGQTFKDCAYVAANEREQYADAVQDLNRDDAISLVAEAESITDEQAATCFK